MIRQSDEYRLRSRSPKEKLYYGDWLTKAAPSMPVKAMDEAVFYFLMEQHSIL